MILTEFVESTKIAFEQIFASKMRSLLSALGVVIGISVVIIMGWLIIALEDVVESTFQMIGNDMIWVSRWDWTGRSSWDDMRNRKRLTYKMCNDFKEQMKSAELVTIQPSKYGNNIIKHNNNTYQGINIEGCDFEFQYTTNGEVVNGRYFTQLEVQNGGNVAIIGAKVSETIFPNGDAIGKRITLMGRHFIVIGVLKKQGTAMMDFIDNRVLLPMQSFFQIYGRNVDFDIGIKAGSYEKLDEVRYEAEGLMRNLRNIKPNQENDFSINETKAFEEATKAIRASVYGVGIGMTMLSFIVGIIGIMNIMFVSVTERTKEIGIRKAVGAKSRSILLQFIIEAAALCFMGALIALIFCSILIYVLATVVPQFAPSVTFLSPYLPINLLIIASFISIAVGVIAGLIPAMRAARLVPVDALRWE
jgi:putative ABC transport system permease protein